MMKKNYIIPYGERSIKIGDGVSYKKSLMCVDNLGIIVEHSKKGMPKDEEVRNHLIGWDPQNRILVQANSLQKALQEFYEYPECKIGTKHKAWEIVDSEMNPVIEYAGCKHMKIDGSTLCTAYDDPGDLLIIGCPFLKAFLGVLINPLVPFSQGVCPGLNRPGF